MSDGWHLFDRVWFAISSVVCAANAGLALEAGWRGDSPAPNGGVAVFLALVVIDSSIRQGMRGHGDG